MNLIPLPAFDNSYCWLLHDGAHAIVIGPGEVEVVKAALDRLKLKLDAILVTHRQVGHMGGVVALQLSTVSGNTVVCCAHQHKYTLANPKLAHAVEPGNVDPVNYTKLCKNLRGCVRARNQRKHHPVRLKPGARSTFLCSRETTVRQAIQAHAPHNSTLDDLQAFAILRE